MGRFEMPQTKSLQSKTNYATITGEVEVLNLSRAQLEDLERKLIATLQVIRRLLGKEDVLTRSERRSK